jgi:dihydrofolate reductase
MKTTLIAAMTEDRVIGRNDGIPWEMPGDQERFYNETFGHPVIMGRKTFENIVDKLGEPLPGRLNIVLSESESYDLPQTVTARNKQAALEAAEDSFEDEVFVAGGESVYEQFVDEADRMVLTWIKDDYEGDSYFPVFNMNEWRTESQTITNDYTVIDYERR